jgi:hypothetical protein
MSIMPESTAPCCLALFKPLPNSSRLCLLESVASRAMISDQESGPGARQSGTVVDRYGETDFSLKNGRMTRHPFWLCSSEEYANRLASYSVMKILPDIRDYMKAIDEAVASGGRPLPDFRPSRSAQEEIGEPSAGAPSA